MKIITKKDRRRFRNMPRSRGIVVSNIDRDDWHDRPRTEPRMQAWSLGFGALTNQRRLHDDN